jgi:hypothetical protein
MGQESPKTFVDPSVDGWERRSDRGWQRKTETGMEFMGVSAPEGMMTLEQHQAVYDRQKTLEAKVAEGDTKVQAELDEINKRIGYMERYGLA